MTAESRSTDEEPRNQIKVLVIDDDPMTCQLLTLQLEMQGNACAAVSDAEQVLAAVAAASPTVVLLDFHLGDQGGLDYRQECEAAGADGFILKPFSLQNLITTIEEVI